MLFYRAPALFDKGRGRSRLQSSWTEPIPLCEPVKGCGQLPWHFSDDYEPFERCKYSLPESCIQREDLTEEQAVDRLAFATCWGDFDWGSLIFTDETSISSDCVSRGHVYREPGTRYDTRYVRRLERSGRFIVSCWGWMSRAGADLLERIHGRFNALHYVHILENVMLPPVRIWNLEEN